MKIFGQFAVPFSLMFHGCANPLVKKPTHNIPTELVLTERCPDVLDDGETCIEVDIPNICKDGRDDKGFCANWDHLNFERLNEDSWLTRGRFLMPVSGNGFSGEAHIISNHISGHPCGSVMKVGFKDFNENGFPVFATNVGDVSIQSDQISVGYSDARMVVDLNTEKIVGRYFAPNDNTNLWHFSFAKNGDGFLRAQEKCFKFSNGGKNFETTDDEFCEGQRKGYFDPGTSAATPDVIKLVSGILSKEKSGYSYFQLDDAGSYRIRRIKESSYAIVDLVEPCT